MDVSFCLLRQISTILRESYLFFPFEQDPTAKNVETWTRMGQSLQWRQWEGHQGLGTGSENLKTVGVKMLVGFTALGNTTFILSAKHHLKQQQQWHVSRQPGNNNTFSDGEKQELHLCVKQQILDLNCKHHFMQQD